METTDTGRRRGDFVRRVAMALGTIVIALMVLSLLNPVRQPIALLELLLFLLLAVGLVRVFDRYRQRTWLTVLTVVVLVLVVGTVSGAVFPTANGHRSSHCVERCSH